MPPHRFAAWACCPAVALLALAACRGGRKEAPPSVPAGGAPQLLDVVVLGPAAKVRPDQVAQGPRGATLVAARNEFQSFQVVINALDGPLANATVSLASRLVGAGGAAIAASNVTVYREAYYVVKTASDLQGSPGRWPDALIPAVDPIFQEARNAFPIDVPAGENRVAWVDVLVPADATPGTYRGALAVRADGRLANVPIELLVLQLELPSTASLKTSFGLSDDTCRPLELDCAVDGAAAGARQLFVRAALDNRVSLGHAQAMPVAPGAGVEQFRADFLPFVMGTASTRLKGARLTSYQVNVVSERDFAGFRDEAQLDGFADRAFVWSCDEPYFFPVFGDPVGNWLLCRGKLEADAATWPQARKLVTAHIQTATDNGALGLIDIMVVNVELLDGPKGTPFYLGNQRPLYDPFLADKSRPKELWLYSACGSHGCVRNDDPYTSGWAGGYQIDGPPSETRAMPWIAFSYDISGLVYYDTVLQLATAWDDQYRYTGNGEGTLFYPGTPTLIGGKRAIPVESLRLKHVRDGLQDYEYLKFLSEHGKDQDARRIALALFPAPYDTNRTDEEIQASRLELARLIAEVTGGPRP